MSSHETILTLSESYHKITIHTFSQKFISNNTDPFRAILPHKALQRFCKAILTFKQSYYRTILHTFFRVYITQYIFRELLLDNTINFLRVYIKQYWHLYRVIPNSTVKLYFSISKSLTFSEIYCHILQTFSRRCTRPLSLSDVNLL